MKALALYGSLDGTNAVKLILQQGVTLKPAIS